MKTTARFRAKGAALMQHPAATQALIAVATLAAFSPTFGNLLMTGWDDQWQVTNRYTAAGWTWANLRAIFTEAYGTQYSPLNQCFYTLLYTIDGYNPAVFHGACLLIHIANGCLVYQTLRRLTADTLRQPPATEARTAFLATLLFAIHPLQVEAVAWVSASKVLLCTGFYLLATQRFISYLRNQRGRAYGGALLLFVCAYGCKEQALIFPVWATVLCRFYGHRLRSAFVWRSVWPFYLVALLFGLVFVYDISPSMGFDWQARLAAAAGTDAAVWEYTWMQRVVFCCYSLVEYLTKWFVPCHLLYLYPFPMSPGEALPGWLLAYPLILVVALCALWSLFRRRVMAGGTVFFVVHLLPVLHLIPIGRAAIVADRYIYLSSVGLAFIAVYYLTAYVRQLRPNVQRYLRFALLLLFGGLAVYTYQRTQVWHDTPSLRRRIKELKATPRDMPAAHAPQTENSTLFLINNNQISNV